MLQEPFVELMKGSLNTFLNAFTYPDRTCYPVASCNQQAGILAPQYTLATLTLVMHHMMCPMMPNTLALMFDPLHRQCDAKIGIAGGVTRSGVPRRSALTNLIVQQDS